MPGLVLVSYAAFQRLLGNVFCVIQKVINFEFCAQFTFQCVAFVHACLCDSIYFHYSSEFILKGPLCDAKLELLYFHHCMTAVCEGMCLQTWTTEDPRIAQGS